MTPLSILYVEDNDDLRETIAALLEADGREITTCADGEAALVALSGRNFDILMTDVSLPGLSGTDLARLALQTDPERWVVLCSGYEFRDGLAGLGPNVRSLPKPFELEDLDALIEEIASQRRTPGA